MALGRTHVGNARRKGGGSCFVPDTLRSRKVDPVLGWIFAYFTIFRSGQSYKHVVDDAQDESDLAGGVLLKAHNTQILTIWRLLGYDSCATETDLASHLMQIRTGEGKSKILGACSA